MSVGLRLCALHKQRIASYLGCEAVSNRLKARGQHHHPVSELQLQHVQLLLSLLCPHQAQSSADFCAEHFLLVALLHTSWMALSGGLACER